MTRLLACQCVLLALSAPLVAQTEEPRVVKLAIRPAAAPVISLEYRLLPDARAQKPGNAAPLYARAALLIPPAEKTGDRPEKLSNWASMPLADLPRDEMRKTLTSFAIALREAENASLQRHCDWHVPIDKEAFSLQLPELQELRHIARALAAKARFEIAEGRTESALQTLQTGFATARHIAEGPTLIHAVLGVAAAKSMVHQLEELIQQPGSPNMYWALTALPRPFIDLRTAMEHERGTLWVEFPRLRDAERGQLTAAQLDALKADLLRFMEFDFEAERVGWPRELRLTTAVMRAYPVAKRRLIAHGRSASEVEALPTLQVVTIYSLQVYRELLDASFKWSYVPYPEAWQGVNRWVENLRTEVMRREGFPFASLLLPAWDGAYAQTAHLDRSIAALRCIEACRLFAAAHGGRLPPSLDAVTEVPIPLDPMAAKPFVYELAGNEAILESSDAKSDPHFATRYRLTIAR